MATIVKVKDNVMTISSLVARKPVNVTAKWIRCSSPLVSPPVINNLLIDGYEVLYGVNDCDCKTISVGVTKYNDLIISGLCSSQNCRFFVVSYSNEEYALPNEWSDVTTLNKGDLSMYLILTITSFLCHHQSMN